MRDLCDICDSDKLLKQNTDLRWALLNLLEASQSVFLLHPNIQLQEAQKKAEDLLGQHNCDAKTR